MPISETSNVFATAAVRAQHTAGGTAIWAQSTDGRGIEGWSSNNYGVTGDSENFPGVRGTSAAGRGVEGWSTQGDGVWGISVDATGVHGVNEHAGTGVMGQSVDGRGVHGLSVTWQGVYGESTSQAGVVGESAKFVGVYGISHDPNSAGVFGTNDQGGPAVSGVSPVGEGVHGETNSAVFAGVAAINTNPNGTGAALYARKDGSIGHAAFLDGEVHVTRSLTVDGDVLLTNGDCAEEFTMAEPALTEPGMVMVIGETGDAIACSSAYDSRVLGVVAGAGGYRPAIILDRKGGADRKPIALIGKVYCQVDADFGPVRAGDLLTTSPTVGHAMRVDDLSRATGAMVGKALAPLRAGRARIPILVGAR